MTAPVLGSPPGGNLAGVLEAKAAEQGWDARVAFVVGDRTVTHGEVHEGAGRAASLLADLGVARGDVVLLVLADGVEFAWAFLGAIRVGAMSLPVNPMLPADDHRYLLEDCKARVVVCRADLAHRFRSRAIVLTDEAVAHSAATGHSLRPVEVDASEAAYCQYTSGTTGGARAAVHRHGDPLVYADAFATRAVGIGPEDVLLSVSKMYFAYGLGNSLFFPLLSGARAVLHPGRPRIGDVSRSAEDHRATVLFAVPTFYAGLVRDAHPSSFSSLRAAVSAGEHLTPALAKRARLFLGCPVLDGLGSTEVGQTFTSNTLEDSRDGTVGRTLPPYEVAVRDPSGQEVAPGTEGLLFVRGPTVLLGYLGKPVETKAVMDGGWLKTGDLALIDEDGYVHHRGRADDMEMVSGISVSPLEIEDLLSGHPAVAEVAVVSLRDDVGASHLHAFVVPAVGRGADNSVMDELLAMARARLAPFKVPRSVTYVDTLPRTATGKLRRFVLRSGGLAPPVAEAR